ncbi:MAG: amidohydrolase [Actinobacteria bacterium]|nr:amidohydrolase [Actinomycetota bacterium]
MGFPSDVGVIDTMLSVPRGRREDWYEFMKPQLRDQESLEEFEFPAQYMFKEIPHDPQEADDPVGWTLEQMDHHNIAMAMVGTGPEVKDHPDRFIPCGHVDPNRGMDAVRDIVRDYEVFGIKAVGFFPAGCNPQVPINDKRVFPIYAKCVELDIPIFVCTGVPGPRLPLAPQKVELIDEVCWFFPELTFVMRHGAEPWTDLAVKLMLKWPNLYYSTSAFAPKYYPKAIVDYANTRGADKVIYAGYFPMGLTLDRIFSELPTVGFNDDVWPRFLRDNARKVLKLDD